MNSAVPSFHSPDWRSKGRGGGATVKFATAAPDGVKRSSGSAVRLPTTVMVVSPDMRGGPSGGRGAVGSRRGWLGVAADPTEGRCRAGSLFRGALRAGLVGVVVRLEHDGGDAA